jgi:hypothetical protein
MVRIFGHPDAKDSPGKLTAHGFRAFDGSMKGIGLRNNLCSECASNEGNRRLHERIVHHIGLEYSKQGGRGGRGVDASTYRMLTIGTLILAAFREPRW